MKNRRLFWRIVDEIEALIDSGVYPMGSRLPPERALAEQFDVSRPTIREAIIALEVRERVEVKTSSGVYVVDQNNEGISKNSVTAFELTQARALVEGEAAALAATTITDEELVALKETLVEMESGENPEDADRNFHYIIAKATRNSAVVLSVENLWHLRDNGEEIKKAYKSVCNQSISKRMEEHTAIYTALVERDAPAARAAMHQHFNRLINSLFDVIEAKALEEVRRKTNETRGLYSLSHLVN